MSHDGYGGSSPFDRMKAAGFAFSSASENVAQGQGSVDNVFLDWKNSPGHYANMIDPKATMIGLARSGDYWTMEMGSPSGSESCSTYSSPPSKQASPKQIKLTSVQPSHSEKPEQPSYSKKPNQPSSSKKPDQPVQLYSQEPAQPRQSKKSKDADLEIPNFDSLVKSIYDGLNENNIDLGLLSEMLQESKLAKDAPYVSVPTTKEKDSGVQNPAVQNPNPNGKLSNKNETNGLATGMPTNGTASAEGTIPTQGQNEEDTATKGANILYGADNNDASSLSILLVASFLMPVLLSIME